MGLKIFNRANTVDDIDQHLKIMEEKITGIISKISDRTNVKLDDNLIYILGFDSKKIMQLIIKLENQFNISISEADLDIDNFNNVNSIVALIKKYQTVS